MNIYFVGKPCVRFLGVLHSLVYVDSQRLGWLVECCFTPSETVGLLGTGAQDGHLDFHTAPELCAVSHSLGAADKDCHGSPPAHP